MDRNANDSNLRAVIYNRIASSASRQRLAQFQDLCRNFCLERGFTVVGEVSDVASGMTLERKGLTRVRQLVSEGQVDAVIIYDFPCLTRSAGHAIMLQDEFAKHSVRLFCALRKLEV